MQRCDGDVPRLLQAPSFKLDRRDVFSCGITTSIPFIRGLKKAKANSPPVYCMEPFLPIGSWDACVQLQDEVFRVFLHPAVATMDPILPGQILDLKQPTIMERSESTFCLFKPSLNILSRSVRAYVCFAPFITTSSNESQERLWLLF